MVPRVEVSTEVVIFAEVEPSVVISGSKYTFVVPAVDGTIVDVSNSTPVELTEGVISAEVVPRVAVSAEKEPRIVVSAKVLETVVTSVVSAEMVPRVVLSTEVLPSTVISTDVVPSVVIPAEVVD